MKEEFHLRFVAILLYQKEWLAYFSKHIIITFDLANTAQPIKWCYTLLTQMLVKLTRWIER